MNNFLNIQPMPQYFLEALPLWDQYNGHVDHKFPHHGFIWGDYSYGIIRCYREGEGEGEGEGDRTLYLAKHMGYANSEVCAALIAASQYAQIKKTC